jgi:hypothetical protein
MYVVRLTYSMKLKYLIIFTVCLAKLSLAQIGGTHTYDFLNLTPAARIAAFGGVAIAVKDHDLNMAYQNPAALNIQMHRQFALNYNPYFADIKSGQLAYAHALDSVSMFSAALQFVGYGDFTATDNTGNITGSFNANDYVVNLSYGRTIDSLFSVGATLKTIFSNYESYTSIGIAADIAGMYYNPQSQLCMSLIARNVGMQLKTYVSSNNEKLPIEVMFGISKRLDKAPFRLGLQITHLEKFDLSFENPNNQTTIDPVTGEAVIEKTSFGKKIMLHMIPNIEIILSKNFMIRGSYNFQRRHELAYASRKALSGLSFGFGFGIKRFTLNYGRSVYNLAGATNHFSVGINLGKSIQKQPSPN